MLNQKLYEPNLRKLTTTVSTHEVMSRNYLKSFMSNINIHLNSISVNTMGPIQNDTNSTIENFYIRPNLKQEFKRKTTETEIMMETSWKKKTFLFIFLQSDKVK